MISPLVKMNPEGVKFSHQLNRTQFLPYLLQNNIIISQMDFQFIIKKETFVRTKYQPISKTYTIHPKKLGQGSYASVYKVKEKAWGSSPWRTAKIFQKNDIPDVQQIINQINMLKRLDHPNIIKIYQILESDTDISLVQDFCEGGDLLQRLSLNQGFSEVDARKIFRQTLEAVYYCHLNKICHRDLKPENILFLKKQTLEIKLVDFGLAFEWSESMAEQLATKSNKNVVGSTLYIAPQMLTHQKYDQRCDIWSLGVILYTLVTGLPPFIGADQQETFAKIISCQYSLNVPEMKKVSNQLKDLIKRILAPSHQRITIEQILKHPWIVNQPKRLSLKINTTNLVNYTQFSKIKKLAANLISSQLSSAQIEQLTKTFQQIDINRDGQISLEEMTQSLSSYGLKQQQIDKIMDSMDADHNGKINYTEFVASSSGEALFDEQNILRAFKVLDQNGNGVVSKQQLMTLFKRNGMKKFKSKNVTDILNECDKDGNGVIDFKEFRACILKNS